MQEEARANTDATGAFTLNLQYPDKPYLVRVVQQGVSYEQRAFDGDALSLKVWGAAPQVRGVPGPIEFTGPATRGTLLHVSDLFHIKSKCRPPLTQAGQRTFEAYLPA